MLANLGRAGYEFDAGDLCKKGDVFKMKSLAQLKQLSQ
jgi:hypothetical protein